MIAITTALLLAAQAAPTATVPAAAVDPDQVVKCRKLPVTGSLARFTKECRTMAEWRRLDEGNRESATKIQDRGLVVGCGSAPTGC